MASPMPKQLGELLRDEQEPFILEAYLLERGCSRKDSNLDERFRHHSGNSRSFLSSSNSSNLNKKRRVIPNCSKLVRAVLNKLGTVGNKQKRRSCVSEHGDLGINEINSRGQETAKSERFSSASNTTVFDSCSDNDAEESAPDETAVAIGTEFQWICREDNKQLSPVSVLEEVPSYEDSTIHDHTKGVLNKSKQLLFNCMKETVGTRIKARRGRHLIDFLGPEELGKLLYEDMRTWSGLSGNETNTTHLLNYDFSASAGEWRDFKTQIRYIGLQVGDAILEDISREIVGDLTEPVETKFGEAGE